MREYAIYDVFTCQRYSGNPLAVVFDSDGLSGCEMQAVASEFNLSETVFLFKPTQQSHSASVRIFTPVTELPFAGHPTVGAAVALAQRMHGNDVEANMVMVLSENVGPVRCAVKLRSDIAGFSEFDLPKLSHPAEVEIRREKLSEALGLSFSEIGFENHTPSIWSAGVPFAMIPLHNRGVVEKIDFDPRVWLSIAPLVDGIPVSAYAYTRGGVRHDAHFHARMFNPDLSSLEDPATGSAAAAFSGVIQRFDGPGDGHHDFVIEQGVEMERPSYIRLNIEIGAGTITAARIGGQAVCVARGTLL